jgi:hypothetical protein
MLKGRLATYPGRVTLVVHEPIDTSDVAGGDPRAARAFAARVREVIAPAAESDVASQVARVVTGRGREPDGLAPRAS